MHAFNGFQRCLMAFAMLVTTVASSRADVFRWDNGALIPGTEGITPGPGVQLDHRELEFAALGQMNLSDSRFEFSNLQAAQLFGANLTRANLRGANLINANLSDGADGHDSILTNADLTGAIVTGAKLSRATPRGFTKSQLYSTASYQSKDLRGMELAYNNLKGWDFHGQNLVGANMWLSSLSGADFGDALITNAVFANSTFTKEQLYSTASYLEKDLSGVGLQGDMRGWNFNGQNLAQASMNGSILMNANFAGANLTNVGFNYSQLENANLTGATLVGAHLKGTTQSGFTKEQLYSTASYLEKNLQRLDFEQNDFPGWDFSGQDLTNAFLYNTHLASADFSGAIVKGASFSYTTVYGFTSEQLYSTASYQAKNLQGIRLALNDVSFWDFYGQNLTNVRLSSTVQSGTDYSFADMRGATGVNLSAAISDNTVLPNGTIAGLSIAASDQFAVRNYQGEPGRGLAPIPITIQGELIMEDGGALQMLFDADQWNSTISFQPGISVTLGGSLELAFADGVDAAAQAGRTFDLFNWDGVSPAGAFTVDSEYLWDLSQLYTTGDVTLLPTLTGDTNGDGQVDLVDLNNVRNNFGGAGLGDTNADGIVDLVDLNAVRNNFGLVGGSGAVPEPSTILLATLGAVMIGFRRSVGRRSHLVPSS